MPTYEYQCSNCGKKFEIFQSIKDSPVLRCSECGKDSLKKLISVPAGLIFKGTGFYLTDYKNTSKGSDSVVTKSISNTNKKSESKEPKTKSKKDK